MKTNVQTAEQRQHARDSQGEHATRDSQREQALRIAAA
jgi:hypothetical protein